ncbi:sporulation protein [Desulfonema magnum]|uniref:Sporulation related domain-containing protein n=1 Tax=Desulfonema magnum TaxID=45655 RepID=A0A975GQN6_9BACT|nr:sporulation protein [Desulfonema magnum]QTA90089.1 Sporulation related domain-containing protein [Desulfonema magnum]
MSFIKRMLSSIGIGSAKVDTILQKDQFTPGDPVDILVKITGGKTEQQIEGLCFSIHCTYEAKRTEMDDEGEMTETDITETALLDKFKLADVFVIGQEEEKEISLSFDLPLHTPLTLGKTKVWIHTGLDIKMAIDPGDKDYIEVIPGDLVGALFDSVRQLGFELTEAECEAISSGFPGKLPFVQEFEFKPFSGPFQSRLDELEFVCFPEADYVEVLMEIDRKAKGVVGFFAEMADMDETRVKFTFDAEDIPDLTDKIYEIIDSRS